MNTIVVIGVGALGKRHLSSILNSKLELDVYCYDINASALDDFEWEDKHNNKSLTMVSSFEEIPDEISFALFAMTSKGRREAFDQLIEHTKVSNILFEKVLFQSIDDYEYVGNKLKELGIKAWVNCARRQMDSYQVLKEELSEAKEMIITIAGGEWGLACNAIHEIDLISFLSESDDIQLDSFEGLIPGIYNSKRDGFKEVYGTITGKCGKCRLFTITCMRDTSVPDVLLINTNIGQFYVLESERRIIKSTKSNNYEIAEEPFEIPYQSQMTEHVLEDILINGESRLATYEESSKLHVKFLKPLIQFFNNNGMEGDTCPIT